MNTPLPAPHRLLEPGERLPDYAGGSLLNLVHSISASVDGERDAVRGEPARIAPPALLGERGRTLLWLIDGLGYERLTARVDGTAVAPAMAEHLQGELTSVFPSATASAITTVLTGTPPAQHGITGWRVRLPAAATTIAPLPFRRDAGSPEGVGVAALADELFASPPLPRRHAWPSSHMHVLLPKKLTTGPYTQRHSEGASVHGFRSLQDGVEQAVARLRQADARFAYLYWPELDHLAHDHGIYSARLDQHLREIDAAFERMLDLARRLDANVLVTSDHGFVDTAPADWIDIDRYPELCRCLAHPLTGEPRVAYAHLRPGMQATFLDALATELDGRVRAVSTADLLDAGWFGDDGTQVGESCGHERAVLRARLGDLVLLPTGTRCLHHAGGAGPNAAPMVGIHGGLLDAEMRIPLVLARP